MYTGLLYLVADEQYSYQYLWSCSWIIYKSRINSYMFEDFFAVYQNLEPYGEEADSFFVLLFPAHQISLQLEIFQQMPEQ